MSEELKAVRTKAMADRDFAKELFINPTGACQAAGIDLNKTEIKILGDAMSDVRKYFAEKLVQITQPPEVAKFIKSFTNEPPVKTIVKLAKSFTNEPPVKT